MLTTYGNAFTKMNIEENELNVLTENISLVISENTQLKEKLTQAIFEIR